MSSSGEPPTITHSVAAPGRRHVALGEHAGSPSWRCRVCGAAWPCSPARLALLGEYREDPALLIYLGTLRCEATADLAGLNDGTVPRGLAERFVTWARAR